MRSERKGRATPGPSLPLSGHGQPRLAAAPGTAVTPDDFTAAPQTLAFAEDETSKSYVVTINQDLLDEDNETYSVALSKPVNGSLTDARESAKAPSDYAKKTALVTFAPGQTSQTVTVSVRGDRAREGNEVFFLLLSNAVNATLADPSGSGGIINDD